MEEDPSLWWLYHPLDSEKLNGQDLWADICTYADNSILTTGTILPHTSSSMTSMSSSSHSGSPFLDASDASFLQTSIAKNEPYSGVNHVSGYAILNTILEESWEDIENGLI